MQLDPAQGTGLSTTRSVSQWERALLAQWFAGTDRSGPDCVAAAYVSERSHDDPRMRNMIVIAELMKTDVNYLIHRPLGENAWILTCGQSGAELGRFRTLPEALHTVRPHRGITAPVPAHSEDQLADVASEA